MLNTVTDVGIGLQLLAEHTF